MSLVFGYTVDRLIYAGLNLKNMAFYSDKFGVSNMARNFGFLMEPTTVGSLWLENDLHENELEFESHMLIG